MHSSNLQEVSRLGGHCGIPSFLLQLLFPPVSGINPLVNRRQAFGETRSTGWFIILRVALLHLMSWMGYTVSRKAHLRWSLSIEN